MKYSPMLCCEGSKEILNDSNFLFEPKFDGTRIIIYKEGSIIKFINRRNKDVSYRYPELNIVKNIKAKKAVLDAELVILDESGRPNFNKLQEREQLDSDLIIKLRSKEMPATLFVFDILEKDGRVLIKEPLIKRKEILIKTLIFSERIVPCPFSFNGKELWKRILTLKMEGIVAKRIDSIYESGKRSNAWLKIKNVKTLDTIIVGFTLGRGNRKELGALCLGLYKNKKLVYVGKVGTGLNKKTLKKLRMELEKNKIKKPTLERLPQNLKNVIWIKPKIVAEVKFLEFTKKGELRSPVFVRIRYDKPTKECTLPIN